MKKCIKCKLLKKLSDFGLDNREKDKKKTYCKKCMNSYYTKLKEQLPKSMKRCSKCKIIKDKKLFGIDTKGYTRSKCKPCEKIRARKNHLKRTYGITLEDYDKMVELQNNKCKICNKQSSIWENLSIDHCHNTGKIRGLLCSLCNSAIGKFKDDIKLLTSAIKYLKDNS